MCCASSGFVRRRVFVPLLSLVMSCLAASQVLAVPTAYKNYTQVYQDGFDGTDFSGNWQNFRTPGTTAGGGSGIYASEAVTEANGNLRIEAYTAPNSSGVSKNYVGSVRSKQAFTFGYFEANIQFEGASGLHQAFWMMPSETDINAQPPNAKINGAELDIVEHRIIDQNGTDISNSSSCGDHYAGYGSAEISDQRLINNVTSDGAFHKYGLYWDASKYMFYIDDQYVGFTINDNAAGTSISEVPEFIIFSNNVGVSWSGPVTNDYGDLNTHGSRMVISSVSVYQNVPEPAALTWIGLMALTCGRKKRR